jgi:F-type H+-transporting ATPase subunit b
MISAAQAAEHAAEAVHHGPFYAQPEFWVGLAFVVVVALAFRKVAGAVTTALDTRAVKIKQDLDSARKMREDAQALLSEFQRKQRDALKEAEGIIDHAKVEAERLKKEAAQSLEESIVRREKQAEERIAQAEAQALAEVRNMAVDLAMSAATKMIAEQMGPAAQDSLIADSIQGLSGKLH